MDECAFDDLTRINASASEFCFATFIFMLNFTLKNLSGLSQVYLLFCKHFIFHIFALH